MKKKVLITGGTGFLGRRLGLILKEEFQVVLAGRNNGRNFEAESFSGCPSIPMDVVNIESVRDGINEIKPEIIIHAAATKFVDLSEAQPMECIDVNVLGSQNIARVAVDKGTEVVIGVSTDKAAPPVGNTYGLTKALMEHVFCGMNGKSRTKFACVRFGNIAWSTGSVLPIWKKMQEREGLIRTTGPEMRRFFFTAEEAAKVVMTALQNIDELQGKVLSRRMKAALIGDMLRVWIENKGGSWEKVPGRPGEKADEILIGDLELAYTTEVYYHDIPHYVISFNLKAVNPVQSVLTSANSEKLNDAEILSLINHVPAEEGGTK